MYVKDFQTFYYVVEYEPCNKLLQDEYFVSYKQAKRRDDDIAIVNMALNVFFEPGTSVVQKAFMAFGGMAATTILARKACEAMIGK